MKNDKEILRTKKWLVIKPLSLKSSLKYGYNTKWCTSSKENPITFYNYSKEGILIYIIERETNTKWAAYWEINELGKKQEMSWWNAEDDRLDSMLVLIPTDIMDVVKKELFLEPKPNLFYLTDLEKENYLKLQEIQSRKNKIQGEIDWEIHRNDGAYWDPSTTSTTFDVDKMVNKTLEHKYVYDAHVKMLKQIEKLVESKEEGN
jgi:hypothetical protein